MSKEIIDYINKLERGSFEGWSKEEEAGYMTCLISIKEFISKTRDEESG
jgi:hypothetical protein